MKAVAALHEAGLGLVLPPHGRISCATCFKTPVEWGRSSTNESGWLLENNPCAWGAENPRILLLGFSKGTRQCVDLLKARHNDIPFAGFRPKLSRALRVLELLPEGDEIDRHIHAGDRDWAFGSVVRCSVAKINAVSGTAEKSGDVISQSARRRDGIDWIGACMKQWLGKLPSRLTTIVLLSNDDDYIEACYRRICQLHPATRRINAVAYGDEQVTWVHIVHVGGPGFNHIEHRMAGTANKQGNKRALAIEALRLRAKRDRHSDDRWGA